MNKIIVDKEEIVANNLDVMMEIKNNSLTLDCYGKNKIIIQNKNNLNLNIIMQDNSFLDILIYSIDKQGNNKINIVQNNNTTINYLESFTSKSLTDIKIINEIRGNNNKSNISYRIISQKEGVTVDVIANVKESKNNELVENIKGIIDGGKITILPNMEINTCDVIANHFVTISGIPKENLFYLESKGISKKYAKEIIFEGFLKSIFKDNINILFGGDIDE